MHNMGEDGRVVGVPVTFELEEAAMMRPGSWAWGARSACPSASVMHTGEGLSVFCWLMLTLRRQTTGAGTLDAVKGVGGWQRVHVPNRPMICARATKLGAVPVHRPHHANVTTTWKNY